MKRGFDLVLFVFRVVVYFIFFFRFSFIVGCNSFLWVDILNVGLVGEKVCFCFFSEEFV